MMYCINLNIPTTVCLVFVLGFWLGCLFIRYLNKPKIPKWAIDYDGTNGKGYQPLANQGQQPQQPKSELPPLKKPKK